MLVNGRRSHNGHLSRLKKERQDQHGERSEGDPAHDEWGCKDGEPGSNGERTDGVCVRMRAGPEDERKRRQDWNFELIHGKEQWRHFRPAASSHSGGGGGVAAGWMVADVVTVAS